MILLTSIDLSSYRANTAIQSIPPTNRDTFCTLLVHPDNIAIIIEEYINVSGSCNKVTKLVLKQGIRDVNLFFVLETPKQIQELICFSQYNQRPHQ